MNKTTGIIIGLVVLAAGVGFFALSSNSDETADNSPTATQPDNEASNAAPSNNQDNQGANENSDATIDIVGTNFKFSQNEITAKPGDTVTVNYSVDSGTHDFVIDELNVQSEVIGGSETDTVTFTIPDDAAKQTYSFYCSIGSHRQQGMEGQLIISE